MPTNNTMSIDEILVSFGRHIVQSIYPENFGKDEVFLSELEAKQALNTLMLNEFTDLIGPHTSLSKQEVKNGRIYVLGDPQADAVDRYKDELVAAAQRKYGGNKG